MPFGTSRSTDLEMRHGSCSTQVSVCEHALVHDTAYASLLRAKRQAIHERIATTLAAEYPESVNTEPELLAHHYTEAGLGEQAIPYWQRAGRRAAERVADAEAREHLQRALKLLQELPESSARDERELEILILLGPVLMNTRRLVIGEGPRHLSSRSRSLRSTRRARAAVSGDMGIVVALDSHGPAQCGARLGARGARDR